MFRTSRATAACGPISTTAFSQPFYVAQITAIGYLGVTQFAFAPILIILPVLTGVFYIFCRQNYYPSIKVVSLYVAADVPKAQQFSAEINEAYTSVVLQEGHSGIRERRSNFAIKLDSSVNLQFFRFSICFSPFFFHYLLFSFHLTLYLFGSQ